MALVVSEEVALVAVELGGVGEEAKGRKGEWARERLAEGAIGRGRLVSNY